ncbi:MAG TPA: YbhB/YbcL family Raf kinase inhibitor-like protein [Vicinamibacterales bacterium]|nr:YbhB/YbcL family Raf kinase inhibitor-like protein [Vicinamibacterales bacterium]
MMSKTWAGALLGLGLLPAALLAQAPAPGAQPAASRPPALTLTTTAFADGAVIPNKYTQAGEQISPALAWTNVPPGTQSYVLHMRDPDVARNKGTEDQVHWLVWGIPGTATGLAEGQPKGPTLPDGSRQISASGEVYRGPGAGANGPMHHYTFELFALDTKIDVPAGADAWATRTAVYNAMQGHILGKAVYVGLFRRQQ